MDNPNWPQFRLLSIFICDADVNLMVKLYQSSSTTKDRIFMSFLFLTLNFMVIHQPRYCCPILNLQVSISISLANIYDWKSDIKWVINILLANLYRLLSSFSGKEETMHRKHSSEEPLNISESMLLCSKLKLYGYSGRPLCCRQTLFQWQVLWHD